MDIKECQDHYDRREPPEYWKEEEIMPMDFPDFKSLKRCAEARKFRQPSDGETEEEFREALADFVEPSDLVESCEIRNKVGWDRFSDRQNIDMLGRSGIRNR